jgi:formate dehydrogenase major subunit
LRAKLTERVQPGVVYTTFHHPETGANVVTTENSDWATNCPEYKVTAVQVAPTTRRPERVPAGRMLHQSGAPSR